MDKYKLIKEYPNRNLGELAIYDPMINDLNFVWVTGQQIIPKEFQPDVTPEWFAPYLFTTEDGVDIYKGEKYTMLNKHGYIFNLFAVDNDTTHFKTFSTKQAAETYLLLEEAKKRYPIGTKVKCLYIEGDVGIISGHKLSNYLNNENEIWFVADGQNKNMLIYNQGKWAEIVEDIKVGDYITYNNELTFKVANIKLGSYIAESGKCYDRVFCRKAASSEIIAHYEKLGWVKGAKYVETGFFIPLILDKIEFDKCTNVVWLISKNYIPNKIEKCELVKKNLRGYNQSGTLLRTMKQYILTEEQLLELIRCKEVLKGVQNLSRVPHIYDKGGLNFPTKNTLQKELQNYKELT